MPGILCNMPCTANTLCGASHRHLLIAPGRAMQSWSMIRRRVGCAMPAHVPLRSCSRLIRQRRGRLILLREHSTDYVARKDADAILKAFDEVEAAWAENDRKGREGERRRGNNAPDP